MPGVSGSPGSVHALRHAADLARQHDAILIPLLTWVPPGGDLDERKHPSLHLRELWKDDAWQRLWDALDRAFGGMPPVSVPSPSCCAASQAGCWSPWPIRQAICSSSAPGARARSGGCCDAASAATAWRTPAARCWPSRPRRWPGKLAMACTAGRSGTADRTRRMHSRLSGTRTAHDKPQPKRGPARCRGNPARVAGCPPCRARCPTCRRVRAARAGAGGARGDSKDHRQPAHLHHRMRPRERARLTASSRLCTPSLL